MNRRHRSPTMQSVLDEQRGAFAHKLPRVKTYRAWRLAGGLATITEARPVPIVADNLEEACAQASRFVMHKDVLFVEEADEARRSGCVHAFLIQEGQAIWRKNPVTGLSERYKPSKAKPLFVLPVDAFEPTRPFDAFRDNLAGVDPTILETKHG